MKETDKDMIAEAMAQAISDALGGSRDAEIHVTKSSDGKTRIKVEGTTISLMALSIDVIERIKDLLSDHKKLQVAYIQSVSDYCLRWLGRMALGVEEDEEDNAEEADD